MPPGSRCGAGVRQPETARPSWGRGAPPQPPAAGNLCRSHRTPDSPDLGAGSGPEGRSVAYPWPAVCPGCQTHRLNPGRRRLPRPAGEAGDRLAREHALPGGAGHHGGRDGARAAAGPAVNVLVAPLCLLLPVPRWEASVLALAVPASAAQDLAPGHVSDGNTTDGYKLLRPRTRLHGDPQEVQRLCADALATVPAGPREAGPGTRPRRRPAASRSVCGSRGGCRSRCGARPAASPRTRPGGTRTTRVTR